MIFVEVALGDEIAEAIAPVLNEERKSEPLREPTTAVFYSISNCQEGLQGISFGNFLIKQVVEELVRELPSLKTFVTLSPVPNFARWLDRTLGDDRENVLIDEDRAVLATLRDPEWYEQHGNDEALKSTVLGLAAHYFIRAKSEQKKPVDPVARFHLGNGAKLQRINWLGDASDKGLRQAHGLMVNYTYDVKNIERNHEAYENEGQISASRAVRAYLKPLKKGGVEPGKVLMLPNVRRQMEEGDEPPPSETSEKA